MKDEQIDQATAYAEYYRAVKDFNSTNDKYLQTAAGIANDRKLAVQKAIEIHINPVLSRVRGLQVVSVITLVLCFMFFCGGCSLVNNSTNTSQTSEVVAYGGIGSMVVLGSLGVGVIALILLMWSSSKINTLNLNIRDAQEKANNPFYE
jgi:hypothetical protein